jgi:hypothetical protein
MTNMPNPVQLQKYLSGVDYPARPGDLMNRAREQGADQGVLDALRRIPDRQYDGPNAVSKAVGELR